MLKPSDFFDLNGFEFKALFDGVEYVWEVLGRVGRFTLEYITSMDGDTTIRGIVMDGAYIDDKDAVVIGEGTVVEPGAFIQGPAIIGKNCQIRNGAYIRGDVIIGNNCTVGHATELKNCIMIDTAQAPHFAYVGDSIIGRGVNLGAGTRLSNVPVTSCKKCPNTGKRPTIKITVDGQGIRYRSCQVRRGRRRLLPDRLQRGDQPRHTNRQEHTRLPQHFAQEGPLSGKQGHQADAAGGGCRAEVARQGNAADASLSMRLAWRGPSQRSIDALAHLPSAPGETRPQADSPVAPSRSHPCPASQGPRRPRECP